MFDFLWMEEWWMETIVAALISGICGIVVGVLALGPKLNQILARLDLLETKHTHSNGDLSKEHGGLSRDHKDLSKENQAISGQINGAAQDLRVLREEQMKTEQYQQTLTEKQLDLQLTAEHIKAMSGEISRLQFENRELRLTIERLETARDRPQTRGSRNQADDWDMER